MKEYYILAIFLLFFLHNVTEIPTRGADSLLFVESNFEIHLKKTLEERITNLLDNFYNKKNKNFSRTGQVKKSEEIVAETGRLPESECVSKFPISYHFLRALTQQPTPIIVSYKKGKIDNVLYRKDKVKIISFLDKAREAIKANIWKKGDCIILNKLGLIDEIIDGKFSESVKNSLLECESDMRQLLLN